jgi:hypothetical protein
LFLRCGVREKGCGEDADKETDIRRRVGDQETKETRREREQEVKTVGT